MSDRRLQPLAASLVLMLGLTAAVAFAWQQEGWKTPPVVSHELEGRDNCNMCHTAGAMEAVPDAPASHEGWPNSLCLQCHAEDAEVQTTAPVATSHPLEGRDNCMMCHKAGAMEPVPDAPASHEGRENQYCTICHAPAS